MIWGNEITNVSVSGFKGRFDGSCRRGSGPELNRARGFGAGTCGSLRNHQSRKLRQPITDQRLLLRRQQHQKGESGEVIIYLFYVCFPSPDIGWCFGPEGEEQWAGKTRSVPSVGFSWRGTSSWVSDTCCEALPVV